MERIRSQDHAAFASLVSRHIDPLYRYALRLSRVPATAEDLVQDTWLAVWREARRFNPAKSRVATWLHRILHNRYIDIARKRARESLGEVPEQSDPGADLSRQVDEAERFNALLSHIDALPEKQRAALLLSHAQGFSNPEIAQIIGGSVRSVESLLARARRTIRTDMKGANDD